MSIVARSASPSSCWLFSLVVNNAGGRRPAVPAAAVAARVRRRRAAGDAAPTRGCSSSRRCWSSRSRCSCATAGSGSPSGPPPTTPTRPGMSGVFAGRMSTLSWAIAGAVAAFTADPRAADAGLRHRRVRSAPGCCCGRSPPAVLARMASLPIALVAGIGIGIVEQLLLWNYPRGGLVEAALFVIILVALLLQRATRHANEEKRQLGDGAAVATTQPTRLRRCWSIRNLGRVIAAVGVRRRDRARAAGRPTPPSITHRGDRRVRARRPLVRHRHRPRRPALARAVRARRRRRGGVVRRHHQDRQLLPRASSSPAWSPRRCRC